MNQTKTVVPLHEPEFEGNERKYVLECLDTGWVSSEGPFVTR
jgi:perosamine synthetase